MDGNSIPPLIIKSDDNFIFRENPNERVGLIPNFDDVLNNHSTDSIQSIDDEDVLSINENSFDRFSGRPYDCSSPVSHFTAFMCNVQQAMIKKSLNHELDELKSDYVQTRDTWVPHFKTFDDICEASELNCHPVDISIPKQLLFAPSIRSNHLMSPRSENHPTKNIFEVFDPFHNNNNTTVDQAAMAVSSPSKLPKHPDGLYRPPLAIPLLPTRITLSASAYRKGPRYLARAGAPAVKRLMPLTNLKTDLKNILGVGAKAASGERVAPIKSDASSEASKWTEFEPDQVSSFKYKSALEYISTSPRSQNKIAQSGQQHLNPNKLPCSRPIVSMASSCEESQDSIPLDYSWNSPTVKIGIKKLKHCSSSSAADDEVQNALQITTKTATPTKTTARKIIYTSPQNIDQCFLSRTTPASTVLYGPPPSYAADSSRIRQVANNSDIMQSDVHDEHTFQTSAADYISLEPPAEGCRGSSNVVTRKSAHSPIMGSVPRYSSHRCSASLTTSPYSLPSSHNNFKPHAEESLNAYHAVKHFHPASKYSQNQQAPYCNLKGLKRVSQQNGLLQKITEDNFEKTIFSAPPPPPSKLKTLTRNNMLSVFPTTYNSFPRLRRGVSSLSFSSPRSSVHNSKKRSGQVQLILNEDILSAHDGNIPLSPKLKSPLTLPQDITLNPGVNNLKLPYSYSTRQPDASNSPMMAADSQQKHYERMKMARQMRINVKSSPISSSSVSKNFHTSSSSMRGSLQQRRNSSFHRSHQNLLKSIKNNKNNNNNTNHSIRKHNEFSTEFDHHHYHATDADDALKEKEMKGKVHITEEVDNEQQIEGEVLGKDTDIRRSYKACQNPKPVNEEEKCVQIESEIESAECKQTSKEYCQPNKSNYCVVKNNFIIKNLNISYNYPNQNTTPKDEKKNTSNTSSISSTFHSSHSTPSLSEFQASSKPSLLPTKSSTVRDLLTPCDSLLPTPSTVSNCPQPSFKCGVGQAAEVYDFSLNDHITELIGGTTHASYSPTSQSNFHCTPLLRSVARGKSFASQSRGFRPTPSTSVVQSHRYRSFGVKMDENCAPNFDADPLYQSRFSTAATAPDIVALPPTFELDNGSSSHPQENEGFDNDKSENEDECYSQQGYYEFDFVEKGNHSLKKDALLNASLEPLEKGRSVSFALQEEDIRLNKEKIEKSDTTHKYHFPSNQDSYSPTSKPQKYFDVYTNCSELRNLNLSSLAIAVDETVATDVKPVVQRPWSNCESRFSDEFLQPPSFRALKEQNDEKRMCDSCSKCLVQLDTASSAHFSNPYSTSRHMLQSSSSSIPPLQNRGEIHQSGLYHAGSLTEDSLFPRNNINNNINHIYMSVPPSICTNTSNSSICCHSSKNGGREKERSALSIAKLLSATTKTLIEMSGARVITNLDGTRIVQTLGGNQSVWADSTAQKSTQVCPSSEVTKDIITINEIDNRKNVIMNKVETRDESSPHVFN